MLKKIILIYFQTKNTLKNNYYYTLKYPIEKEIRVVEKMQRNLHHQERVIICLISNTFDFSRDWK
jgi:hypothetical protein